MRCLASEPSALRLLHWSRRSTPVQLLNRLHTQSTLGSLVARVGISACQLPQRVALQMAIEYLIRDESAVRSRPEDRESTT